MDLISRQDAIEAIKEDKIDLTNPNVVAVFKATGDLEKVETQVMTCDRHIEILKDLPSAQPEIIHCRDCKYWMPYDWMFSEVWKSKNMEDYPENEIGCMYADMSMSATDFCSRAERREDDRETN